MSGAAHAPGPLLDDVLALRTPAFALLHRPERAPGRLEVLAGPVSTPGSLAELPLPEPGAAAGPDAGPRHDTLILVPYRQLAERGFACADDGAPLVALGAERQESLPLAEALARLPRRPVELSGGHFDTSDDAYADLVRRIVTDEIGQGQGANFVIKRSFVADVGDYTPHTALGIFRRLVENESGAYWTFLVHTGQRTLVGATPERHVSLDGGTAVMNPISGTYRYPPGGPTRTGVLDFLADRKEADELYMVVDEELKMMARICADGGRVVGPRLKEMARLAHTEYVLTGHSTQDPRTVLRETMFAPTVTGSPLESACRVIDRYETEGRGYYSGVIGLLGRDAGGGHALDSAILIRTADIDAGGRLRIGVGATLVRHSDPRSEVAETAAKAEGLLGALRGTGTAPAAHTARPPGGFDAHPDVRRRLEHRNDSLARFWFADPRRRSRAADPALAGRRVLMVDAEDTFTAMMCRQLGALGLDVTVRRFDEPYDPAGSDLVVLGPGPGDPRDTGDPRIAHLHSLVGALLDEGRPFFAVCLSHQVLSLRLGLDLVRRATPNQGVRRDIDLFGNLERVGFYNTFTARSEHDKVDVPDAGAVEVCRAPDGDEVYALRGPRFASIQFHAESVLTEHGPRVFGALLRGLL
ncbi:anthranilate synthase family protein [Streptomyces silvensis]|uniref:anthranilate synthase n=1 Tax=Streptomyces silvensis TaxID=1765722 RepID=A0A0W7XCR4_9ACTN|nr:anthranilate synthase family protein [Streptomyces silvensis]KUF20434.1 anthranilate synthase [Streptomyces silvensis]